jgi:hypothetical protein
MAADQGDAARRRKLEELKTLLRKFAEHELAPELLTEITLDDPVLLLLAQFRSFRISRLELFSRGDDCESRRAIRTWGQLATHMQVMHDASKEETSDIVRDRVSG